MKNLSFSQILEEHVKPNLFEADQSAEFVNQIIRGLIWNRELPTTDELRTDKELIFALIDFPKTDNEHQKITPHNLTVLNSTNSVRIDLTNFKLKNEFIINRRPIGTPPDLKPVKYWRPEIGIARECLKKVEHWLENSQHPKADVVRKKAAELKNEYNNIEQIEKDLSPARDSNEVNLRRERLIHASLRLWILANGSSVLKEGSEVLLLQNQITLMDVWIQDPELITQKIQTL